MIQLILCLVIYIAGVIAVFSILSYSDFIRTDRLKSIMYLNLVFNYMYIGLYVYRYIYAILWPVCLAIYIGFSVYKSLENFMMDPILVEDFTRLTGKNTKNKDKK